MSHLSDIGFTVTDQKDFSNLLNKINDSPNKKIIEVASGGGYMMYRDTSGAELWIQIDKKNEIAGINPHYSGKSSRLVTLARKEERDGMDGAFSCWIKKLSDSDQDYPVVFDVPDFYTLDIPDLPKDMTVQLTAFADKVDLGSDEVKPLEGIRDVTGKPVKGYALADEAFIPIGQFNLSDNSAKKPPSADAMLSGIVLEIEEKLNEFTGEKFYWMRLKTISMEIDVVCDKKLLINAPKVNSIISGHFWISGTIKKT